MMAFYRPFKHYWNFTFEWEEPDPQGVLTLQVEPASHEAFDTLDEAMRIHEIACKGQWVKPHMRNPRVSELREYVAKAPPDDARTKTLRLEVNDVRRPEHPCAEVAATQTSMEVGK